MSQQSHVGVHRNVDGGDLCTYPTCHLEEECGAVVSRCDLYSGMTDERAPHKRRYLCATCCICLLQGGGLRIETGAARSAAPTCRLDGCSSVVHGHMSMGRFDVRRVATRKWYTWWQPGARSSRAAPRRAAPHTHGRTVDLLPLRRAAAYWKRVATSRTIDLIAVHLGCRYRARTG